jgi:hypothetical protein
MAMPGALTNLGYGPAQAQSMTAAYPGAQPQLGAGTPYNFTGSSQQQQQSGGDGLGKKLLGAGLNAGTGIAAGALLGKIGLGGATAAKAGGIGALLGGTGAATLGIGAGALAAGLLWKKSQAHHEANDWVQGNQNPFDNTMTSIDKAVQAGQMDPMQAQQTKMTNAKNYIAELNKFAQQGSDQRKVAGQALQTFVQHYGDPAQYGVAITF